MASRSDELHNPSSRPSMTCRSPTSPITPQCDSDTRTAYCVHPCMRRRIGFRHVFWLPNPPCSRQCRHAVVTTQRPSIRGSTTTAKSATCVRGRWFTHHLTRRWPYGRQNHRDRNESPRRPGRSGTLFVRLLSRNVVFMLRGLVALSDIPQNLDIGCHLSLAHETGGGEYWRSEQADVRQSSRSVPSPVLRGHQMVDPLQWDTRGAGRSGLRQVDCLPTRMSMRALVMEV